MVTVRSVPCKVDTIMPFSKSVDIASPPCTWYLRILANSPIGSANNSSNSPSGRASNAASVGANTVNGPSADNASTNPASITAVSKVL